MFYHCIGRLINLCQQINLNKLIHYISIFSNVLYLMNKSCTVGIVVIASTYTSVSIFFFKLCFFEIYSYVWISLEMRFQIFPCCWVMKSKVDPIPWWYSKPHTSLKSWLVSKFILIFYTWLVIRSSSSQVFGPKVQQFA